MASTTTTHRGSGGSITGEASVAYLYAPGALAAISHFLPSGRFVALLREPSARALSEYNSKLSGRFVLMHTQHRSGRLKREERDGDAPTDGSTAAADRVPDFSSLVWEARRAMAARRSGAKQLARRGWPPTEVGRLARHSGDAIIGYGASNGSPPKVPQACQA